MATFLWRSFDLDGQQILNVCCSESGRRLPATRIGLMHWKKSLDMNRAATGVRYIMSGMVHPFFCDSNERQITPQSLRYILKVKNEAGPGQWLTEQQMPAGKQHLWELPAMRKSIAIILLVFGPYLAANADIWKWVDEHGNVHYSDTPAREFTMNAERVSHRPGNRSATTSGISRTDTSRGNDIDPQETPEERRAREDAQAYYCNRAKDIYHSYVDAPRLYRTSENGEREYLSDQEAADALASAKASVAEWCNQTMSSRDG